MTILAHKIALKTSRRQKALLEQYANHARFAYNWALERWNIYYKAGLKPSVNQIDKDFNRCKKILFPWIYDSPKSSEKTIGIDLGIKTALVTSEGGFFESPRPLRRNLKRLRLLQKELSRRKRGSSNYNKTKLKLRKLYSRIKSIRQDFINKVTTKLSDENQVIFLENLNVKGMLKNSRLSKDISDISFYEIKRQLDYKVGLRNGLIYQIDRWFPSSKTCSCCGNVKKELKLSERKFKCGVCGLVLDRDLNASININTVGHTEIKACGDFSSGFEWLKDYQSETKTVKQESKVKEELLCSSTF